MTQGIITKGIGGFYYVRAEDGNLYETRAAGKFRKERITPRVGDIVGLSEACDAVVTIFPRKNEMIRPPVANIDNIAVVASLLSPKVDIFMIDAFLLSAAAANIEAFICINKSDLCDASDVEAFSAIYRSAGYRVVVTSAKEEKGIEEIKPNLKGLVTAFAGNSGVGKSSLLNKIGDDLCLETGAVSEKLSRGKHTTRHVELFPLSIGGYILDTPGFSRVELPPILAEDLWKYYPEFARFGEKCKFAGCNHMMEPDCAVKAAVSAGTIHEKRYESYQYFYEKLRDNKFWKTGKEE